MGRGAVRPPEGHNGQGDEPADRGRVGRPGNGRTPAARRPRARRARAARTRPRPGRPAGRWAGTGLDPRLPGWSRPASGGDGRSGVEPAGRMVGPCPGTGTGGLGPVAFGEPPDARAELSLLAPE